MPLGGYSMQIAAVLHESEVLEQSESRALILEDPWPAMGIDHYSSPGDGRWGYLMFFSDGAVEFDESRVPSLEEILEVWETGF